MAFEPRLKADGTPCCFRVNESGQMAFPPNACQPCIDHATARGRRAAELRSGAHREDDIDTYEPIDSYRAGLTALRAASETPASKSEDRYKAERFAKIEAEAAEISAANDAAFRALDTSDLGDYKAPDIYAEGIKRLQAAAKR